MRRPVTTQKEIAFVETLVRTLPDSTLNYKSAPRLFADACRNPSCSHVTVDN